MHCRNNNHDHNNNCGNWSDDYIDSVAHEGCISSKYTPTCLKKELRPRFFSPAAEIFI